MVSLWARHSAPGYRAWGGSGVGGEVVPPLGQTLYQDIRMQVRKLVMSLWVG